MNFFKLYALAIVLISCGYNSSKSAIELRNGDIIFQTSKSRQSKAIQLATNSKYSHCGIIFKDGDNIKVLEAVQPVKLTPVEEWITRGENQHFVIKRLKNSETVLTPRVLQKMKLIGKGFIGRNYDMSFEWSDKKIYCSELVWKIYHRAAGIKLGKLEKLSDFNLSNPIVANKLKERYGNNLPLNETVISPSAIFESKHLKTVTSI